MSEVTYDFVCPMCGHKHFEAIGGRELFRCFSCSQTFTKAKLRQFVEWKLHPERKRTQIIQIMSLKDSEKRIESDRNYRETHREQTRKYHKEYMRKYRENIKKMFNENV